MAGTYEIPLTPAPQVLSTTIGGVTYQFTLLWRDTPEGGWFLDIADSTANPIVSGVSLITGADLLAQYAYLGLGFSLFVQTDDNVDAVPTFDNLGVTSHLYAVY